MGLDRQQATVGSDLRLLLDTGHELHAGAVDVGVQETDAGAHAGHAESRVDADRRFPHTPLGAGHGDGVAHQWDDTGPLGKRARYMQFCHYADSVAEYLPHPLEKALSL